MNYFSFSHIKDTNFWRQKLKEDYEYPEYELEETDPQIYRGIYQYHLVSNLLSYIDGRLACTKLGKTISDIYGDDKEILRDRARQLRTECNLMLSKFNTLPREKKLLFTLPEFDDIKIGQLLKIDNQYIYYYRLGRGVGEQKSIHPQLPPLLFEDNTCQEIETIYGIKLERIKL